MWQLPRPEWYDSQNDPPRHTLRYVKAKLYANHLLTVTQGIIRTLGIPCSGRPSLEIHEIKWEGFCYTAVVPSDEVTTTLRIVIAVGELGSTTNHPFPRWEPVEL